MKKIEIQINGHHACYLAAKSRREALERVTSSQEQKVGAIWEAVRGFMPGLPVSAIDLGRI